MEEGRVLCPVGWFPGLVGVCAETTPGIDKAATEAVDILTNVLLDNLLSFMMISVV